MKESQLNQKLKRYLAYVIQHGGSDFHLSVGDYPVIRVDSELYRLDKEDLITASDMESLAKSILNEIRYEKLQKERHLDFSIDSESGDRFRANLYYQLDKLSLALRYIPKKIRTLKELNFPEHLYDFTKKSQGLILVTGPTGHGKSTTLAALMDHINDTQQRHVVTIEDPIEYIHESKQCLINQREIYKDANDFPSALRSCFRQDCDVILVGEMRDLETISTVITAAETGHLILATLHTNDSVQTIDRIIDVFPAHQQNQVRSQLSNVLLGVISQRLLKKTGGGRVPAIEILVKNPAVENLIRQNQTHQVGVAIETSLDQGMISINRSIAILVKEGKVALEDAEAYVTDMNTFRMILERL